MGKEKKQHPNFRKVYMILMMFATLFMGIGYAAINSVVLDISGDVVAEVQDGIFITHATIIDDVGNSSSINGYYQTMLMSDVVLPDASSTVTMQLTIYNSTADDYTFNKVSYTLGEDTYSNANINYSLTGLDYDQMLIAGDSVTFTITFSYVDVINISSYSLKSILNFEFEKYIVTTVTFDYNYLPNNAFEEYYDTSSFKPCCDVSNHLYVAKTNITTGGIEYEATLYPSSYFDNEWIRGYFFSSKSSYPLEDYETYTLTFEVKGSGHYSTALIGSEQDIIPTYNVSTEWTRYTYTFEAYTHDSALSAFVVYDWVSDDPLVSPTIKIRNIQMQKGTLNVKKVDDLRVGRTIGNVIPDASNDTNLSRDGWTFLGWFTDPLNGEEITSETIIPLVDGSSITYYAHWIYNT